VRKAVLIYNPISGNRRSTRLGRLNGAIQVLREAGVEAQLLPTESSADTTAKTRQAVGEGCDSVIACGGDGTVHDVLRGLAGTETALGVIPAGTGNVLAYDLGIPLTPSDAARTLLHAERKRMPAGTIHCKDLSGGEAVSRYFAVAAGVGADAYMFHNMDARLKQRWGMASYYAKAWQLWLTHAMQEFIVRSGEKEFDHVTQLLAVRVAKFGSLLQQLIPGASLEDENLRFAAFRTSSRMAYLQFVTRRFLRSQGAVKGIEMMEASSIECEVPSGDSVFVEADGEVIGRLPARISVERDAFTLLVPRLRKADDSAR
jgi:diacylglycerol kinase (ATP)